MAISTEIEAAFKRADEALADLRSLVLAQSWTTTGPDQSSALFADEVAHWSAVDWPRRQRKAWKRRGHLMSLVADAGGSVAYQLWCQHAITLGYTDSRGLNGFFAGEPPVFIRDGDFVRLTPRGFSGAAYWKGRYG